MKKISITFHAREKSFFSIPKEKDETILLVKFDEDSLLAQFLFLFPTTSEKALYFWITLYKKRKKK